MSTFSYDENLNKNIKNFMGKFARIIEKANLVTNPSKFS